MNFPSPSSAEAIVSVTDLTRRFGSRTALENVSLFVPRGCVFGLVGENGAGKTTLIKHLLGLLRPQSGSVRVFGCDPIADTVNVLSRIGYLSENRDLPAWMRVDELLRYTEGFYPKWDRAYANELLGQFALPAAARIRTLSQGQLAKLGLLVALAYRPELLLLDEPSSGLDPLVRRDILEAIIRSVADEGRSVLFSSHLLDEIERVADSIAMIHQGRIVLSGPLDQVKQNHRRLIVRFNSAQPAPPKFQGALSVSGCGREWKVLCSAVAAGTNAAALGGVVVEEQIPSLDEIFLARSSSDAKAAPA
jgi:ABC-2 type transport system ATP-binding protein